MKQNIIIAALLFVIGLNNANAQDSLKTISSIAKKFQLEFPDASKVEWTNASEIFVAKFLYQNNLWLAYFNVRGEKLAVGRKIRNFYQLPIQVQHGVIQAKTKQQRKFGSIEFAYGLEMIENGTTKYFVPMENEKIALILSSDIVGNTSIVRKIIKNPTDPSAKDLVAKNN